MTRLHFQPIQGKAFAIIDAILRTEEAASAGKMLGGVHLVVEEVVVNIAEHVLPHHVRCCREDGL